MKPRQSRTALAALTLAFGLISVDGEASPTPEASPGATAARSATAPAAARGKADRAGAQTPEKTTIVPEPASVVLVVTGLAGLMLRRRMSRQRQENA